MNRTRKIISPSANLKRKLHKQRPVRFANQSYVQQRQDRHKNREGRTALLFLLPSMTGICLFFLFPFADTVRRSFYDVIGNNFVGLRNYQSVLDNAAFQLAAANTAKFITACLPLLLLISLIMALIMHSIRPGGKRIKTLLLLPMAIPVASMVLLWQVLFEQQGLLNRLLITSGRETVDFMGSSLSFWILIGTYVWKNAGYDMVLWLAGLDSISASLYEAARVDGAGTIRCFRYITLPNLLPTLAVVAIISLLNSFKVFREAYMVAGAYPNDYIYQLQHLFNNWFTDMDISRLCAAAVLLCLALLVIILLMQRFLRSDD